MIASQHGRNAGNDQLSPSADQTKSRSKVQWRAHMREASASWLQKPSAERVAIHAALEKNLEQILQGAHGIWGVYSALPGEPALDVHDNAGIIGGLSRLRFAFPKVEGERALRFFIPKTKDSFLQGSWGVAEPDPHEAKEVAPDEMAGVLIPALAFDRHGIRLGRGKGYYDRWLSNFRGTKVGVAYAWQIASADLPREAFDIPMDIVVTEQEIFRRPQE